MAKRREGEGTGLEPGEDYQDLERQIDRDLSSKTTREGEKLAAKLGISLEELDRRLHTEDARRDAAGLPPLANTAIRERAALDDFGGEPEPGAAKVGDSRFGVTDPKPDPVNEIGGERGPPADESAVAKAAREERQREAMEAVQKRFHQADGNYYYKDDSGRLAFSDRGGKLVTQEKDAGTASAMATMAEAKGWTSIKVGGNEQFRREAWLEASLRGIEVKGFQPKEADLAALEIRRDQRSGNTIWRVGEGERVREEPTLDAVKREAHKKQQVEDYNLLRPTPAVSVPALRTYSGKLLEHGAAHYNHDPDEKQNYFVKLATESGEQTVWGVDLKRAVAESQSKAGDELKLEFQGKQLVTVQSAVRDKDGKVVGHEEKEVHRNQWDVQNKSRVVEAVASAVAAEKIQNPETRQRVMDEVNRQLEQRAASGKPIPSVKVYDKDAPARPREDRARPPIERNTERTR